MQLQQENLLNQEQWRGETSHGVFWFCVGVEKKKCTMREAAAVRRTPNLSRSVKRCKLVDTQRGPSRRHPPPILFSSIFQKRSN